MWGGDREPLPAPALGLGAVQYVVGEEAGVGPPAVSGL